MSQRPHVGPMPLLPNLNHPLMEHIAEIPATRPKAVRSPESALWAHVVWDAIATATGGPVLRDSDVESVRAEARRWIASDSGAACSFLWCCEHLGIDPSTIRAHLQRNPGPLRPVRHDSGYNHAQISVRRRR